MAAHHPALLDIDASMPRWETASYPPFNLQQDIVIVPLCCDVFWNDEWNKQTADCTVVRDTVIREEIVQKILAARNQPVYSFDEDFIADCYALAAARLLLALINRNLYYLRTPDESRLKDLMTDALKAVRNHEPDTCRQAMQRAFDEVAMSKDNYHPSQNYFIELLLVTHTTVGESLRQCLQESTQINLFMPGSVLETLPETHPETFSQLKSAIEQKKIRFIVDDTEPESLTLLPILDVADRILAGISLYRDLLNVSPKVYGRLAPGLSPVLPQMLKLTELNGAIHFAPLAGWKIKENDQSKILWQGTDKSTADALIRYPIDASAYLGFFTLSDQLSSQINHDSVPTSVFALFPGQKSGWLDTLRRINHYTSGLGKFVDIEEYFTSTTHSGGVQHYGYEKYPASTLTESDENPISQWHELYRQNADRLVRSSLETLLTLLSRPISEVPLGQQFAETVSYRPPVGNISDSRLGTSGHIAVNPLSFARKMFVGDTAVDVPSLGYAYVEPPAPTAEPVAKKSRLEQFFGAKEAPVLARKAVEDIGRGEKRTVSILENRYFTAKFDVQTGALRSIFTNRSRYNQLSRQIAFRNGQTYSIQSADEITITKSTTESGQIKIVGRLVSPEGELVARYTETITIRSQSRLLECDLTLDPVSDFDADRWNSYIAVRYAWNDDTYEMFGNLNDGMYVLPDRKHLHAPKLIDLRHEGGSLTFLSEGLPFHRRSGDRQLDTLLIVQGESHRQFRLGIAINETHPAFLSYDFLLGQLGFVFPATCRPKNPSSWLFQIESKNVMALYWEPVWETEKVVGCMVYLQETEGRRAHFALRSFMPPKRAAAMNFLGKEVKTFKTEEDAVLLDMHPHELLPLMIRTVGADA